LPAGFAASGDARARFEREAKTISSLYHPNICTLFDVGRVDHVDYL
jgi:serine/threonine protein kinase